MLKIQKETKGRTSQCLKLGDDWISVADGSKNEFLNTIRRLKRLYFRVNGGISTNATIVREALAMYEKYLIEEDPN